MQIRFVRRVAFALAVLIAVGLCFVDAGAQRRKRRPRRSTIYSQPSPSPTPDESSDPTEPKVVSTADQSTSTNTTRSNSSARPKSSPTPTPESEQEALRRTITDLSGQVNKLSDKLSQMEEQQRSLVDIERLSRAEQRAEGFRTQLRDVQDKETDIQAQLDQIEYALQPENIDRAIAIYGTTHPEQMREQRRKQLENQRAKLKAQYDQLEQSRVRLEAAIATADQEVETLRARIDAANANGNQPGPKVLVQPVQSPTPNQTYVPPPKPPEVPPR